MTWRVGQSVRIATRASELALWQAHFVAGSLKSLGVDAELVEVSTQGDEDQRPLSQLSGSGFFTKAVQRAVLDGDADIAVHSYKDLPSAHTPGLALGCMPQRADPRDVLLIRPEAHDASAEALPLRPGALVGTSAARRREQLLALRHDLRTAELRGNVPTRLAKLADGQYDAVMLARAGLDRLGSDLTAFVALTLPAALVLPAPAQGALAVEARSTDAELLELLDRLDDPAARAPVLAERELMSLFDAGCQLALGALATRAANGSIDLSAWFDGRSVLVRHADPQRAARLAYRALTGAGRGSAASVTGSAAATPPPGPGSA